MSIAEYQSSLKKLIDATTDEATLKRWKAQLEGDLKQTGEKISDEEGKSSLTETGEEPMLEKKENTSDYVVMESGLGIDE
jgi:hypothetical protein